MNTTILNKEGLLAEIEKIKAMEFSDEDLKWLLFHANLEFENIDFAQSCISFKELLIVLDPSIKRRLKFLQPADNDSKLKDLVEGFAVIDTDDKITKGYLVGYFDDVIGLQELLGAMYYLGCSFWERATNLEESFLRPRLEMLRQRREEEGEEEFDEEHDDEKF